jgi:uncharacterized membrane protein YhaH (DUF805 family)
MTPLTLFTSFQGRIGRAQFWLGVVMLLFVTVGGVLTLAPEVLETPVDQPMPAPGLAEILFNLIVVLAGTALSVKRFNDRDRPYWWGFALGALGAAFTVAPLFGWFVDPAFFTTAETALFGLFIAISLFALVDNGFLKGTPGPNRYGPDPLAGPAGA